MSNPVPWKLKPQYVKVEIDDATSFDVPLYPSQLVDEAILWAELKKDESVVTMDAVRRYVALGLKLREVIPESVPDKELFAQLTVDLAVKLFELFFYGPAGKPEIVELEEETEKKKRTGRKSSGSSSSTTQTSSSSTKKTLAAAQSA